MVASMNTIIRSRNV